MTELSGKALGIAVAKEMMGWKQHKPAYDYEGPLPVFYDAGGDGLYVYRKGWQDQGDKVQWWAPWRDMNDAWEVVESLQLRWKLSLILGETDLANNGSASFSFRLGRPPYHRWVSAIADTVPKAILRAALKAKGREE